MVCVINDATGEVLAGPDLVSRGFVYVRDNEDLMADATVVVRNSLEKCKLNGFRDWATIKGRIRDELGDFIAAAPTASRSSCPLYRKYKIKKSSTKALRFPKTGGFLPSGRWA